MKLGTTIQRLRKEKKISQGEFADKIGISPTSLSQIENNKTTPKPSTLDRICSELSIPSHVLHLLSLTIDDVPEGDPKKKALYDAMYPQLREWMLNIFYEDDAKELIK